MVHDKRTQIENTVEAKPVFWRVFPPLIGFLMVLAIVLAFLLWQQYRLFMKSEVESINTNIANLYELELMNFERILSTHLENIAETPDLQEGLKSRDVARLKADWQPVFENLKANHNITLFYFMDNQRRCILRLHNPEMKGDLIKRETLKKAEQTGQRTSGVEFGYYGFFSFRVVQPVFEAGESIGYIELGVKIKDVVELIPRQSDLHLVLYTFKNYLHKQRWEDAMRFAERRPVWNENRYSVINYTSLDPVPKPLMKAINYDPDVKKEQENLIKRISFKERNWTYNIIPLDDISGRKIGGLLIVNDITPLVHAVRKQGTEAGLVLIVVYGLLFGFIFKLLRRTDRMIFKQNEKLQENEEQLRLITDNISDVIWLSSPDYKDILYISPSYEKVWGVSPENLKENPENFLSFIHPEDKKIVEVAYQDYLKTGYFDMMCRINKPDKQIRWVTMQSHPVKDEQGTIIGFVGRAADITELKEMQIHLEKTLEDLKRKDQELASIVETQHEMICRFTPDFRLTFVNEAYCRIWGVDKDKLIGRYLYEIVPKSQFSEMKNNLSALNKNYPMRKDIYQYRNEEGKTIWREWTNYPLFNSWGDIDEFQAVGRDITQIKEAEMHIEHALQEKETLIREIYHRTNNNMQTIQAMMILYAFNHPDIEMKDFVRLIRQRIQTMSLVHQKLYKSQNLSRINLGEYIEELAHLILDNELVTESRIKLILNLEPVIVLFDTAIPLGLVIHELLANAVKHAFPINKKGKITIELTRIPPDMIEINLSDNGSGFPEGFHIDTPSTGGLSTVFSIVESQMKGSIHVDGKMGVHYTIRFKDDLYKERV